MTDEERAAAHLKSMEYWAEEYQRRDRAARELLARLRNWDVIASGAGDAPYWRAEIDKIIPRFLTRPESVDAEITPA